MNYNSKTVHSSYSYHHSSSTSYSSSRTSTGISSSSSNRCVGGGGGNTGVHCANGARGMLAAESAGHCAVRFVPHENGVHQIHVRQNAVPVAGSPFNVLVGKQDADPAKVGAYGDGLSKGRTRELRKLTVDTLHVF